MDKDLGEKKTIILKTDPKLYRGSFADYARISFEILAIKCNYSDVQLEEYF